MSQPTTNQGNLLQSDFKLIGDSFAGKEIFSKRKISSTKEIHSVFIIYWIILLQCANIL